MQGAPQPASMAMAETKLLLRSLTVAAVYTSPARDLPIDQRVPIHNGTAWMPDVPYDASA